MFDTTKAFSGFAVRDVAEAATFYTETLGVTVSEENGLLTLHLSDDLQVMAYPKPDHTPATFTILNFPVDDIDTTVDELSVRGASFEHYEAFDHDDRGIVRAEGGPPIAWFADPSGNILSVLEID